MVIFYFIAATFVILLFVLCSNVFGGMLNLTQSINQSGLLSFRIELIVHSEKLLLMLVFVMLVMVI